MLTTSDKSGYIHMCVRKLPVEFVQNPIIFQENYEVMRQAIRLRASLVPYIYSHARYAYDEGNLM